MRSLLGRFHRPMSRGLVNNMLTMNNLGDGSTLSLDFTTMGGVLDPRLTFSRASTATFVNSSGYVEWAGANTAAYSESLITAYNDNAILSRSTTTSPTGNTAVVIYPTLVSDYHRLQFTYAVAMVGATTLSVYVKQIGSNYRVGINSTGYIGAGAIFSLVGTGSVVAVGGTAANRAATITKVTDDGWYRIALTGTYATITSTYLFMDSSTSTDHTGGPFTGVASQGVSFWGFQINPGSTTQTYYPTTATVYYAPRFDYSPTNIGEPMGLLVEGQSANLTTYSEDFANINWTKDNSGGFVPVVTTVAATTPANGASVNQIVFDKTGGLFSRIQRTSAGTTSTPYTMSVWMRTVSGTANVGLRIGADPAGFNCAVTTTWKRFQYTYTLSSTDSSAQIMLWDNIIGNDEIATVYVWGCQVEAGSSASSYIPTGASQVTRNGDSCVMTGTNFSSWFAGATEGVLFAQYEKQRSQSGNAAHDFCAVGSRYITGEGLILYHSITNFYPTAILWPTIGGAVFGGGIATAIPSVTKQALKWFAANDVTLYSNGVVGTTGTGSGTVTPAMLSFGANSSTGTEATRDWLNACVRRVKFYPTALSDAAIQTLTTP